MEELDTGVLEMPPNSGRNHGPPPPVVVVVVVVVVVSDGMLLKRPRREYPTTSSAPEWLSTVSNRSTSTEDSSKGAAPPGIT